jgi:uncharacterized protein (TIGR03790 family)
MPRLAPSALTLTAAIISTVAQAASPGPENVVIVANANSALSRNIAEYYALKRGIPRRQVCYIKTTSAEWISRPNYEAEIEGPVGQFLMANNLAESTLYLVTTSQIPLKIEGSGDGMNTTIAAVDSELTLVYQVMRGRKHQLNGPLENPYFRATANLSHPRFPMYLVTRLSAYDFKDVKAMIDRALVARNQGNFVIDLKGDSNDEGNQWLRDAMILLPTPRTVFDETRKVLGGLTGVIGYASWGSNDPSRKDRFLKMQWLPGAIATEYVSTNARTMARPPESWTLGGWKDDQKTWWAGSPQTMSADYIHEGVTGVSGHVWEPYLAFCPRPQYILPAYYNGENLAESFYRGIPALSWQNIVMGDPLCSLGHP